MLTAQLPPKQVSDDAGIPWEEDLFKVGDTGGSLAATIRCDSAG